MANQGMQRRTALAESEAGNAKKEFAKINEKHELLISRAVNLERENLAVQAQNQNLKEEIRMALTEKDDLRAHVKEQLELIENSEKELNSYKENWG